MAQGKDPETADAEPVIVVEGQRAGLSRLVDDPDQIAKVVHTQDAPIEPSSGANARESTLRPMRTVDAPHQDVQVSPDEASVWTAAKTPE